MVFMWKFLPSTTELCFNALPYMALLQWKKWYIVVNKVILYDLTLVEAP
jgi:hypothetical protein